MFGSWLKSFSSELRKQILAGVVALNLLGYLVEPK